MGELTQITTVSRPAFEPLEQRLLLSSLTDLSQIDTAFAASDWAPEQSFKVTSPLAVVIVDNQYPGFSTCGLWRESSAVDEYEGSSLYTNEIGATASWRPDLSAAGEYEVHAWWSAERADGSIYDRDSEAEYTIHYNGGSNIFTVDQDVDSGRWNLLGTFPFEAGEEGYVELIRDEADGVATSADAVKFVRASPLGLFTDIGAGLPGAVFSSVAWGDYDNDGDLDALLSGGLDSSTGEDATVYRNDGGTFTNIHAGLPPGYEYSRAVWGDYDNDGDLDILYTAGYPEEHFYYVTRIYRNENGAFTDIEAGLPGVEWGAVAWGDYDNDGDLDVLMAGMTTDGSTCLGTISRIYSNDEGIFRDIEAGLPGVWLCDMLAWGDYDNDGDLDVLLGGDEDTGWIARIYRNDSGTFTDIDAGLPDWLERVTAEWGDYDSDGDLDVLLAGWGIARIYRNDSGTFTDIDAGLPGVAFSSAVAWGDYDNDGDLDALLSEALFRNDDGTFTEVDASLPEVSFHSAAWGDYDNDGDLDILWTGWGVSGRVAGIHRNNGSTSNSPPAAPKNLSATTDEISLQANFAWDPAADDSTPAAGLTYNVRVGTSSGGHDVFSGMADSTTGLRRLPAMGNVQQNLSWTLNGLDPTATYYWSVQAIDTAFAASDWAPEQSFELPAFVDIGADLPGVEDGT